MVYERLRDSAPQAPAPPRGSTLDAPYLRALSRVPGRVPGLRPPRVDDPVADTFGFGDRAIR